MPFLTRPHFEDRQIVQYSDEVIHLSGTSYIAATILDFTGTTTGETSVTINSLTGYLNGQRLSGLVVEPAQLKLSGSTGTTTQNVTGFVLQSIDPYGSVEWAPLSGVSWSVSACTSPLYVSTIEACPNPTDPIYITAGNVQFGASPSLIADITNTRLGIGTGSPSESLHVNGGDMLIETSNGKFYTDLDNAIGPRVLLSGTSTDLISISASEIGVPAGVSIGTRGFSEASLTGYGKQGDGFFYSSAEQNGLNIISQQGTSKDDYIRFYAGQDASAVVPDLHIQGSGGTRGNIGVNTDTPEEKLHIQDGNLLVSHNQDLNTKVSIKNNNGSNDAKSVINFFVSGSSLPGPAVATIQVIGPDSVPTGTFMGSYLPNSMNITTSNLTTSNRMHINIGSRRGSDAQTRFFGGSDDFDSSSLLGIFYTSGLTITDMVNTDTLRVRDGATSGYVLTSDANGNATWQYNSTGFSGNTSASCITDLYVSNLYGCSPITVHDEFVSNSGGGILDLRNGGTDNTILLGNDSGSFGSGYLYLNDDSIFLQRGDAFGGYGIRVDGDVTIPGFASGKGIIVKNIQNTMLESGTIDSNIGVVINSKASSILSGTTGSVIIGGDNIVATSDSTVYVPNLNVSGEYILHSNNTLEVSSIPGSLESLMKGSYTEFNHSATTANVLSNNNPSGFTSFILGDVSQYPTNKPYGFISYFNSGYTRTGAPSVGADFNRGKLFLKAAEDAVGMVINPRAGDPTAPLWFEMDGTSVMKLQGDGAGKATLGIAMSQDGTETASANLQIGGTGTTGTFKYIDGNEQSGYVLTSDSDGNATWQVSTASGGTGGGITIDPYEDVGNVNSITWDVSGTSTNYEATLTGNTTLNLINVRNGDYGTLITTQDGVGGHTLTFGSGTHLVSNGGGGSPVLTATAGAVDVLTFTYNGTNFYWTVGNDYT